MCLCLYHRPSRNLSEKKRRDKLNVYISELAAMVPACANSQRKLDKTTVLKMTVGYMKVHNGKIMILISYRVSRDTESIVYVHALSKRWLPHFIVCAR